MAAPTAPPAPSREARRNARVIFDRLLRRYPTMGTALDYRDPWQLIVATVLSAQTTDEMVNRVTPVLFERWPTPHDLAEADPEAVEQVVYPTGFYRRRPGRSSGWPTPSSRSSTVRFPPISTP
jgi:endonuclease-3